MAGGKWHHKELYFLKAEIKFLWRQVLMTQPRLTGKSLCNPGWPQIWERPFCLSPPGTEITGKCHHVQLNFVLEAFILELIIRPMCGLYPETHPIFYDGKGAGPGGHGFWVGGWWWVCEEKWFWPPWGARIAFIFLTECLLPAVYHEMEMAETGQHRWTILGFIGDWPNCCHADLPA